MKKLRVAINGYGRIGRAIVRAVYEKKAEELPIQIVAINGLGDLSVNAHLTQYDTTHGKFPGTIEKVEDGLLINNQDYIHFFSKQDPSELPWKALDIDIVYECTGCFTDRKSVVAHLKAGAKKVLVAAPMKDADITIVYGVNHALLKEKDYKIVSASSCTTNALASIIEPLQKHFSIQEGFVTTVHAYTSDQRLLDNHHKDFYRARSATQSIIPTQTGAASAIGVVFPKLQGKIKGVAIRVPTPNVSLLDFTFNLLIPASVEDINHILKSASENQLKNILDYTKEPLVSSDFNHNPSSATVLGQETVTVENLMKVFCFYDNEWGFSNRLLDITIDGLFSL